MCLLYILVVLHWWSRRALNMQPSWSSTLVTPTCFEHAAFLIILHWWPRRALNMQPSWSFYTGDPIFFEHAAFLIILHWWPRRALNLQPSLSFYTGDPDVFEHAAFLSLTWSPRVPSWSLSGRSPPPGSSWKSFCIPANKESGQVLQYIIKSVIWNNGFITIKTFRFRSY
jgi:hypothetical protein